MAWEKFKYAEQETVLPAKILLIDELASFLDNQPREKMRLVDEFQDHMQNITRLGRAAHVHLIAATQSCTSSLFPPSLKNNIAFRTICGRVEANISRMAIDSDAGESIAKVPGSYLGYVSGDIQMYQGYWTPKDVALNLGTFKEGYELFKDEDGEVHLEIPEVEGDDDDDFEEEIIEDNSIFEFSDDDLKDSEDEKEESGDVILQEIFNDEEDEESDNTIEDKSDSQVNQETYDALNAFLSDQNKDNKSKDNEPKNDKITLNFKKKEEPKKINLNNKFKVKSTEVKDNKEEQPKKKAKISYIE